MLGWKDPLEIAPPAWTETDWGVPLLSLLVSRSSGSNTIHVVGFLLLVVGATGYWMIFRPMLSKGTSFSSHTMSKDLSSEQDESFQQAVRRKRDFLKRSNGYGYPSSQAGPIDTWRRQEFPQLIAPLQQNRTNEQTRWHSSDTTPMVYLDFAGAGLASRSQLEETQFETCVWANPHSTGPAASQTLARMQHAKKKVLDWFHAHPGRFAHVGRPINTDDTQEDREAFHPGYEVIFTSGATDALRIVAEHFAWSPPCPHCGCTIASSRLVVPQNSHTSVVGMRGPALQAGATFCGNRPAHVLVQDIIDAVDEQNLATLWRQETAIESMCCSTCKQRITSANLLVLPAECNFGGDRLEIQPAIQKLKALSSSWSVMVDLAKAASTSPIDLRHLDADFACLSFYKLFGAPTGLGALLVKRGTTGLDRLAMQENDSKLRRYFGGGTVDVLIPGQDFGVRRLSDPMAALTHGGTTHFRGIAALSSGFDVLNRLGGMDAIQTHTSSLASELVQRLESLRHANGKAVVVLYGACWKNRNSSPILLASGPTVAFNLQRDDETFVGYNEVAKLAALSNPPLQLRTGCFCNPGACQLALGLTDEQVMENYRLTGHVCGDQVDIINGQPTGAIRASFGKDSIWEDLDALVTFIQRVFVSSASESSCESEAPIRSGPQTAVVSEVYLFPIKSCAAQRVKKWKLCSNSGKLVHDREFALIDSVGTAMRLQSYPQMAFVQPSIDLDKHQMTVAAPGRTSLVVSLDDSSPRYNDGQSVVAVCGNRCGGVLWGDCEASTWFSEYLGVQCWLARYSSIKGYQRPSKPPIQSPSTLPRNPDVAFANEQPLLLISEHAVDVLNHVLLSQQKPRVSSRHFRPNITVRLAGRTAQLQSHSEDAWKRVAVHGKGLEFDVVGACARCSMVDVDPSSGMRGNTLRALADYRRHKGQITFGIFLRGAAAGSEEVWLEEGDLLVCNPRQE